MSIRSDLRKETAGRLNTVPKSELQALGISRVAEITWMDVIGIPIWKSTVPNSATISVNSGKGLDRMLARAGAIAEAIEFKALEGFTGPHIVQNYRMMTANRVPNFNLLPLAANSEFNLDSFTAWEPVNHLFSADQYYFPSDAIYTRHRLPYRWNYFQTGSNGAAAAGSVEEALLVSLYELIERDAWVLTDLARTFAAKEPAKISLEDAPEPIADALDRIKTSGSTVMLFDITGDIGIRAFGALIFDLQNPEVGIFAGYGCSSDPIEAALRSILEACQSRACYIDGARDDFVRRSFYLAKNVNHRKMLEEAEELPFSGSIKDYLPVEFESVQKELDWVKGKLRARGLTNLFWKLLWSGSIGKGPFHVVKAISLDLEMNLTHLWRPRQRAFDLLNSAGKAQANVKAADNDG